MDPQKSGRSLFHQNTAAKQETYQDAAGAHQWGQ
jgi:hypothetical protein